MSREPIPVAYLLGSFDLAGTPRHVIRLLSRLDRKKIRPSLYCFVKEGPLLPAAEALDLPIHDLRSPTIRHPAGFLRSLIRLWRLLRGDRPRILHNYLFPANFFGSMVGKLAGVPVILTTRRCEDDLEPRRRVLLYRLTNPLVTRVISVSRRVTESVIEHERLPDHRIATILNGIEIDEPPDPAADVDLPALRNGAPIVGTVSNLKPVKGLDTLIRAVARLRREFPRLICVIVGEGELRGELETLSRTLDIADAVVLVGRREDVPRLLSRFDVFTMSSLTEGISNSILEAMAARLPIVATSVGGNREIVDEGVNGLLVPPGDDTALAEAVAVVLRDPRRRRQMGQQSRRIIEADFSLDRMAGDYEALYTELLS